MIVRRTSQKPRPQCPGGKDSTIGRYFVALSLTTSVFTVSSYFSATACHIYSSSTMRLGWASLRCRLFILEGLFLLVLDVLNIHKIYTFQEGILNDLEI